MCQVLIGRLRSRLKRLLVGLLFDKPSKIIINLCKKIKSNGMYEMERSRLMTILTMTYLTAVIKISFIFSG